MGLSLHWTLAHGSDSTAGIINTAELIASDQPDPNSTPNNHNPDEDDQASVLINSMADLAISKSDAPDPVDAGSPLTYTLNVTNNGPNDTLSVEVVDVLPGEVVFQSASGSGWVCSETTGTVTCTRSALVNGATSPDIAITVTAPADGGTISNSASTSSLASDTSPADNAITIDTTVNPVADLFIGTQPGLPDPQSCGTTARTSSCCRHRPAGAATNGNGYGYLAGGRYLPERRRQWVGLQRIRWGRDLHQCSAFCRGYCSRYCDPGDRSGRGGKHQ